MIYSTRINLHLKKSKIFMRKYKHDIHITTTVIALCISKYN